MHTQKLSVLKHHSFECLNQLGIGNALFVEYLLWECLKIEKVFNVEILFTKAKPAGNTVYNCVMLHYVNKYRWICIHVIKYSGKHIPVLTHKPLVSSPPVSNQHLFFYQVLLFTEVQKLSLLAVCRQSFACIWNYYIHTNICTQWFWLIEV